MNFFKSIVAFFTSIVMFFGTVWNAGVDAVNSYSFTVDTSDLGDVLVNPASNVNIWSIQGNPFVGVKINEENNIFEKDGIFCNEKKAISVKYDDEKQMYVLNNNDVKVKSTLIL